MSQELIDRSSDLKKLRDEGYEIEVKSGYALVHHVPFVNAQCEIKYGTLISTLTLSGDRTITPDNHVIYFDGEYPCNKDGSVITGIQNSTAHQVLAIGVEAEHSFSNKPPNGYPNYYEKFTRYIEVISAPARSKDDSVTAQTFNLVESSEDSVFNYLDTNTSRAGIGAISDKLRGYKIGIVGLGGTGTYVLDLIAKTTVEEIHLFDGDDFLQHNAFRAPGAPAKSKLEERQKKTDYFASIYQKMHKHVFSHPVFLGDDGLDCLLDLDFVFLCIDTGYSKRKIVDALLTAKKSFVDTGIGLNICDDFLLGTIRLTTVTSEKSDHLEKRISFSDSQDDDPYASNIQIAELNSLNAALAVIKWKQLCGFYQDLIGKHNMIYTTNDGETHNED